MFGDLFHVWFWLVVNNPQGIGRDVPRSQHGPPYGKSLKAALCYVGMAMGFFITRNPIREHTLNTMDTPWPGVHPIVPSKLQIQHTGRFGVHQG